MINLIYNASFLVSKIVQVLIFSTFIAVVFVTFLVSVPVLFALEVYCLLIVITVLTVFSGSEEARLTIGERFLSIAGIFLIYDAVSALISTFKSSDSKVKYKYKIYLGHFRAKTRRTPNSGSSYLESKARPKASTRFAISYTLVAPLIAAAVLSMPALYFLSDSIYNFWFVFTATLLFAPVFYFLLIRD